MIEITVKVSNSEQTLTQKFLHHCDIPGGEGQCLMLSHDDEQLSQMVNETISKFKGQAEDVVLKIKYTW